MADTLLEVDGLSVDIKTGNGILHAVRNISFSVKRGETLCLVGESGCGKSMTSLAIMDLLPKGQSAVHANWYSPGRNLRARRRTNSTCCAAIEWR